MQDFTLVTILIAVGVGVVILLGLVALIAKFYRQIDQGKALIVNKMGKEPLVSFTGATVFPVIHRAEVMDISVKTIEISRTAKDGLICADNIRADIKVAFFVRVNKTVEDVLKVAQTIGCARASDSETLETLFTAKFSEALKTVGKRLDFEELYTKRHEFKEQILQVIGQDLNGYALDDCAIDYLEQTPLSSLDPHNILDAHGIRKITEITAGQNILTNDLRREEEKKIKKKNTETAEATMELDRQQADAAFKQQREIASVKAREEAEASRIQSEERKKSELARIKVDEELAINEENKRRQIEVAIKNRERVVLVEQERVVKDQQLEAIGRERETELKRIEKEKALEAQRKEIADIIRSRVAVDKTVAEEEERIKDVRVVAAAKRAKDAKIIEAEAQAEQELVKQIKAAQAGEEAAKFAAKQRLVLADAELEASDRTARAQMRLAEGTQAESAAAGLAAVRVKGADAAAIEKLGAAEARVHLQKMEAEARGREQQGLADVKVREANAVATERTGAAEASAR
ncbi:MAG TPA: SPFH domain-containing protein, partial [Nannocystaceae bacterium]|nr:SPFH domain-containing protein [Nannocystaceae bacterium]